MAKKKKAKRTVKKERPRRTQNVPLTEQQRQSLIRLWQGYHGGAKSFATKMAAIENAGKDAAANAIAAKKRALHRIEDRETGVSQAIFKTIADVFGNTTEELKEKISAPSPAEGISALIGPWITDESILAKYRRIYHGYYITKKGDDYFWMHHQIDFSEPYPGCLHATMDYGLDRPINFKIYAFLFREMLVAITQNVDDPNQQESVAIYHDFRRPFRGNVGHFGLRVNEDWNGDFGLGASIMLWQPIEGTENEGQQNPAMSKKLTQYWKELDGERCNRLLHLFGFGPFIRTGTANIPQEKAFCPSNKPKKQ